MTAQLLSWYQKLAQLLMAYSERLMKDLKNCEGLKHNIKDVQVSQTSNVVYRLYIAERTLPLEICAFGALTLYSYPCTLA